MVKERVLIVGLSGYFSDAVSGLSADIVCVDSEQEALKNLKESRPSLVVSRWDLPDSPDGEFLKKVHGANPNILIVVIIDSGNTDQEVAARKAGAVLTFPDDCKATTVSSYLQDLLAKKVN